MDTLEAMAVSGFAMLSGESQTSIRPPTVSIFELNRVYRTAREQEVDFFDNVSPGQMHELFRASHVNMPWDILDASLRDLRRRLMEPKPAMVAANVASASDSASAQASSSEIPAAVSPSPIEPDVTISVGDALLFFAIVCPWNSVDQIASLVITTSKAAGAAADDGNGGVVASGLTPSQVAQVLRIAGVEQAVVAEYLSGASSDTCVDYDALLSLFHEYPTFQEHTITNAKLKREATKKFAAAADFPRSPGPTSTLQQLAHHAYDGDVVECLRKLRPPLPRDAVSAYLADGPPSAQSLLPAYVAAVDVSDAGDTTLGNRNALDALLRIYFGPGALQLILSGDEPTHRIVASVACRIHSLLTGDKSSVARTSTGEKDGSMGGDQDPLPSAITVALVFAVLLLNEDLRSSSVSTAQKWGSGEVDAMLRPLWSNMFHGGGGTQGAGSSMASRKQLEELAKTTFSSVRESPIPSVFGDAHNSSGWASKKTLLAAFRLFLDGQRTTSNGNAATSVVKEVLGNIQASEDAKRIREACDRATAASIRAACGELEESTSDLKLLERLYARLLSFVGESTGPTRASPAPGSGGGDAVSASSSSAQPSLMDCASTIASSAKSAAVQAVANKLVFYDVDRLEGEVGRLEQMVQWLDGYSQDLLARSQAVAAAAHPPAPPANTTSAVRHPPPPAQKPTTGTD